jgi:hypothetical protein
MGVTADGCGAFTAGGVELVTMDGFDAGAADAFTPGGFDAGTADAFTPGGFDAGTADAFNRASPRGASVSFGSCLNTA